MPIQDNISEDYLAQYNLNLGVSATSKINNFAFIQQLTYNGILNYLKQNFLGLQDWQDQIALYSSTNTAILTPAFTAIKTLVPLNLDLVPKLVELEALGTVGNLFEYIQGYNKVFSLTNNELTDTSVINQKASNFV